MAGLIKLSYGNTQTAYNNIVSKDSETLYICKDGHIYLGTNYIANSLVRNLSDSYTDSTHSASDNYAASTKAVYDLKVYLEGLITSGVTYRGSIAYNDPEPSNHIKGWLYKFSNSGTVSWLSQTVEMGDLLLCINNGTSGTPSDWTVIQTNITGAVTTSTDLTGNGIVLGNGGKTVNILTSTNAQYGAIFLSRGANGAPGWKGVNSGEDGKFLKSSPAVAGVGQDPVWASAVEPGTNVSALTNHTLVIGKGGFKVGSLSAGNSGDILISQGANADPTWFSHQSSDNGKFLQITANGLAWASASSGGSTLTNYYNGTIEFDGFYEDLLEFPTESTGFLIHDSSYTPGSTAATKVVSISPNTLCIGTDSNGEPVAITEDNQPSPSPTGDGHVVSSSGIYNYINKGAGHTITANDHLAHGHVCSEIYDRDTSSNAISSSSSDTTMPTSKLIYNTFCWGTF